MLWFHRLGFFGPCEIVLPRSCNNIQLTGHERIDFIVQSLKIFMKNLLAYRSSDAIGPIDIQKNLPLQVYGVWRISLPQLWQLMLCTKLFFWGDKRCDTNWHRCLNCCFDTLYNHLKWLSRKEWTCVQKLNFPRFCTFFWPSWVIITAQASVEPTFAASNARIHFKFEIFIFIVKFRLKMRRLRSLWYLKGVNRRKEIYSGPSTLWRRCCKRKVCYRGIVERAKGGVGWS